MLHRMVHGGLTPIVKVITNGDYRENLDIGVYDDNHIYIKSDPRATEPKHVMSYAISKGVTSRVHIYVRETENHSLEIVSIKPY